MFSGIRIRYSCVIKSRIYVQDLTDPLDEVITGTKAPINDLRHVSSPHPCFQCECCL